MTTADLIIYALPVWFAGFAAGVLTGIRYSHRHDWRRHP